jgi:hypothetical protein
MFLLRLIIVAFLVMNTCNSAQAFKLKGLMNKIKDASPSVDQKTIKPVTEKETTSNLKANDEGFSSNSRSSEETTSEDVLLF